MPVPSETHLRDDIHLLRARFHCKLADARGIPVSAETADQLVRRLDDDNVQTFCENLSLFKRMATLLRRTFSKA